MLNVGLAYHDSDWNWKNVFSPFTRIFLVVEGTAQLHLPNRSIELRPGRMYIIPAHTIHSYECHGKFIHYYLHIHENTQNATNIQDFYELPAEVEADETDIAVFASLCSYYPKTALPASDPMRYDNEHTFASYVQRYNKLSDWDKLRIRGCLFLLLSRFVQHSTLRGWTKDERLLKALHYINSHLYDNINIESVAAEACLSKQYFISLFNNALGVPPLRYINRKKIERAQLFLLAEKSSVQDIAYRLGFNDVSYFIRLFKHITGTSPNKYRKTLLN